MNPGLDTLVTALYARIDDLLASNPHWLPQRPAVGIAPKLSDAELVALAVLSALLGFDSEARFIRHAKAHLKPWFPYVPERPGYNKRLRRSGELMKHVLGALARDCPSFHDDVQLVDSTPVECGRSRNTAQRSDLAGWATYGYCASHSRWLGGAAPAPHHNTVGAADRLRAHRRQNRRTRHLSCAMTKRSQTTSPMIGCVPTCRRQRQISKQLSNSTTGTSGWARRCSKTCPGWRLCFATRSTAHSSHTAKPGSGGRLVSATSAVSRQAGSASAGRHRYRKEAS